jgi:hypothetical protein
LQDVHFYAQAGEIDLCLASINKVRELHEQMSKILGDRDWAIEYTDSTR